MNSSRHGKLKLYIMQNYWVLDCSSVVNHPYFPQGVTVIQLTRTCTWCTFWYEWYIVLLQLYILITEQYRVWWSTSVSLYQTLYGIVPDSRLQVPSITFEHSPVLLQRCGWVSDSLPLRLRSSRWLGTCAIWGLCS